MSNYILFSPEFGRLTAMRDLPESPTEDFNLAVNSPKPVIIVLTVNAYHPLSIKLYHRRKSKKLPCKVVIDYSVEGIVHRSALNLPGVNYDDVLFIHNSTLLHKFDNPIKNNFHINFHAVDAYRKCILNGHPFDKTPVAARTNGLNLLIGKIKTRYARFLTTYYFYKHSLLDTATLGLHALPEDFRSMMEKYSVVDEGFYNKIVTCLGPADNAVLHNTNEGLTAMDGWPYDPNIYNRSSISYACETFDSDRGNSILVTEKFYRSIVNRHPFVIQASPGYIQRLKFMGYETFSSIIDERYNIYDKFDGSHVEPAVLAAKDLLSKVPDNTERIQEIVDHNFNHFLKHAEIEYQFFQSAIVDFANGRAIVPNPIVNY